MKFILSYLYARVYLPLPPMIEGRGGGSQIANLGEKNHQAHLIIIKERPKNTRPPVFKNLENFPLGVFYSTPAPSPTIRHKRI